jgi:outer membrane protein
LSTLNYQLNLAGMKPLLLLLFAFSFCKYISAQEKWNLLQCVEYAKKNNVSIRQSEVQEKISEVQAKQNRLSKYPNANFSTNTGYRLGRSENPTTGILEDNNFLQYGANLQTSVDIFNWYSRRNTIAAGEYDVQAAQATTDKLKNDIALTVANSYLQVLLSREQEKIAEVQLKQSQAQLTTVRKQVKAGTLPELNAAMLEAQVATDSANLISVRGNSQLNLLYLKAYMNMDAATPFDIIVPPSDKIPVEKISDLQPEAVYASALQNLPQQKLNDLRIKAAEKYAAAARGNLYPTISLYGGLGTNYVYFRRPIHEPVPTGFAPTGLKADAGGGVFYDVVSPVTNQGRVLGYITPDGFGKQVKNNFGQSIGVSVSVPIFNGYTAKGNLEKSKLQIDNLNLQKELDANQVKQDIYQAYNAAVVALQKYNASEKSVAAAERSFEFATKRFNVGMLPTFELTTNQNNLLRARLERVVNRYDYIFKMKVLEFYKGQGLKL